MVPGDFRRWLLDPARRPLVMGILNLTPDSFSDGGRFNHPDKAVAHAASMIHAGADVIDIGAESTRPGSARVPADVQRSRLTPIVHAIRSRFPITLSIDTTLAPVAAAALDAGVDLINDVSAGRDDPGMLGLAASRRVPLILMHMQGEPATMQIQPSYQDVCTEVSGFLADRLAAAKAAGVDPQLVLLDPGIGFGKNTRHNLELLRHLSRLTSLGRPLVVGASRKRFIGDVTADKTLERLFGTAATVAWAVANGASVVRVHDVAPMRQVARMIEAIQSA